jgi:hypothetical protein
MLVAYMDESGHSKDPKSHFCGIGGLVADSAKWETLEVSWGSALREAGVKGAFHMRQFAHRQGEFKGWTEAQRKKLLAKLVETIVELDPVPVGCVIWLDHYNSCPELIRTFYREPYFMAFQTVTKGAALQALPLGTSGTPEGVAMVYASQKEFGATLAGSVGNERQAGAAQQLWLAMKERTTFGPLMGSYGTASPEELCPLQAADLFAYELTKEFENLLKRPNDSMRWPLRKILRPIREQEKRQLIQFFDAHDIVRVFLEATGQDRTDNALIQTLLTQAWAKKIAIRDLLEERIAKFAE